MHSNNFSISNRTQLPELSSLAYRRCRLATVRCVSARHRCTHAVAAIARIACRFSRQQPHAYRLQRVGRKRRCGIRDAAACLPRRRRAAHCARWRSADSRGAFGHRAIGAWPGHDSPKAESPRCRAALRPPDLPATPEATNCSGGPCSYFILPADFAAIYDLNPVYQQGIDGSGQTIAIIGRARVYLPDIENFQSHRDLAVKDPSHRHCAGRRRSRRQRCRLAAVPPKDQSRGDARCHACGQRRTRRNDPSRHQRRFPTLNGAGSRKPIRCRHQSGAAQIMNISFGACEADVGQSDVAFFDSLFSQAAMEGISVFVSSGDSGAAGCDNAFSTPPASQVASANYICASSYATCVGGTEFADMANPSAYWSPGNGRRIRVGTRLHSRRRVERAAEQQGQSANRGIGWRREHVYSDPTLANRPWSSGYAGTLHS